MGFKLVSFGQTQPPETIGSAVGYLKSVLDTMMQAHEKIHIEEADWARTIRIGTGDIKTTQFNLSAEQKQWLYDSGYRAADKFFRENPARLNREPREDGKR